MVKLDTSAIEEFLTFGVTLNRKTFEMNKKYTPKNNLQYNGAVGKPSIDRVIKAYENCILETCENKNNIIIQLSGGKDCRLIAAILKKNNVDFSAVVYGDGKCLDVRVAKMVARALKIPLTTITDVKDAFNMQAARDIVKSTYGLRFFDGLLMQYHLRNFLGQFDLVLDGYCGNSIFDAHCCSSYPEYPWLWLIQSHSGHTACCRNNGEVLSRFIKEHCDKNYEEILVDIVNENITIMDGAAHKFGVNNTSPINQDVLDAIYAFPYEDRVGLQLTQKMMHDINRKLWLLPYSTFGGLPFGISYKWHACASTMGYRYFPNWKFADPIASAKYNTECFSDYIKTLPQFVHKLSILDTEKSLKLLKASSLFRNRLMNVKIWSEIHDKEKK